MAVEVQKEVTTTTDGPAATQVSQTTTAAQVPTQAEAQDAATDRGNAWIWYLVGIVNFLLLLRLVFYLFGARAVGFADTLYTITRPLVAPFQGIFASPKIDGSHFDTASLAAIIVYTLVGWAISRLIDLATRPASSNKV